MQIYTVATSVMRHKAKLQKLLVLAEEFLEAVPGYCSVTKILQNGGFISFYTST